MKVSAILMCLSLCLAPAVQPAQAQTPPHETSHRYIDFTQVLHDMDGNPIHVSDDKSPLLTLGEVCRQVLSATLDGDPPDGSDKQQRFALATLVWKGKHVELTSAETNQLVKRIRRAYSPVVVGVAIPLVDPALADVSPDPR